MDNLVSLPAENENEKSQNQFSSDDEKEQGLQQPADQQFDEEPETFIPEKANYIYIWTVNTHFFSADTANLWENTFFVVSSRYWTLFTKPATLIANLPWAETISVLFIQNSWILWAILSKKTNSQKTKCSSRITNNELGIMGMLQCEGKPGFTYFNYLFSVRSSLQISFLNAFCIKMSILATLWSNFM